MRRHTFDLLTPETKTAWDRAAGKERGARPQRGSGRMFERVDHCYRVILGRDRHGACRSSCPTELDEVLADYAAFKRAAAVLDFDDLLERARTLVRDHDAVRRALGRRYRHIFVDEFQDTDPIQAEILFRIAADDSADAMAGQRRSRRRRFSWSATRSRRSIASAAPTSAPTARRAAPSRGSGRTTSFRSRPTSAPAPTILDAHQSLLRSPAVGKRAARLCRARSDPRSAGP